VAFAELPRMTEARQTLGKRGEELACAALEARGYMVIERRYRTRAGEIDVVARSGDTLVFVEVKARQDRSFGVPAAAVTPQKQRRLVLMATEYLHHHRLEDWPCRFDVVAVEMGKGEPEVEVIVDAFRPGWS
jgi:putative endonuclease